MLELVKRLMKEYSINIKRCLVFTTIRIRVHNIPPPQASCHITDSSAERKLVSGICCYTVDRDLASHKCLLLAELMASPISL
jgi:hypothetical protein